MKKKYEYKCPDCGSNVEYGNKFCNECSCKLDWDEDKAVEEKEVEKDIDEKTKNKYKKIRVINLFVVSFVLCMSAYLIGVNSGIYDMNLFGILLAAIIDFGLYTLVFMIYPIIIRIKNKHQLTSKYLPKLKTNSIVGAFIIAVIISVISYKQISAFSIGYFLGYFGRMLVYSIMYFYINKWLFIKNSNNGKNSILSIILFIVLVIVAILCLFGYKNNGNLDSDPRLKAKHILVEDYGLAKEIINELENGKDFCDLVEEYSIDTATVDSCGDVGYVEYDWVVEEFYDAVLELEIGKFTKKPVRTDYGYHIIYRED